MKSIPKFTLDYFVMIFTSISLYIGSLIYLKNIENPIDISIPIISSIDFFLSISLIIFFLKKKKSSLNILKKKFTEQYLYYFNKYTNYLYPILLYTIYKSYYSYQLISQGVARHDLIAMYKPGFLIKAFIPLFVFGFSISLVYKVSRSFFVINLLGLIASLTIAATRSELLTVGLFSITFLFFRDSNRVLKNKLIIKLFLILLLFLISAVVITVFVQRRISDENFFEAILPVFSTIFEYRAFSFYLAEVAIESSNSIEKIFYPFFGYLSEKPISLVETPSKPIDSDFVLKLFEVGGTGGSQLANVLYPWWSWFYGVFGFFGLFLKLIYVYGILSFVFRKKYCLTFMYLITVILFSSVIRHPLLTVENIFYFIVTICIDLLIKRVGTKNFSYEN